MTTKALDVYTPVQADANWDNLSPERKAYFNRLAENDPDRTGQAFYEDTVPVELQDKPELVEVYLDGGEVEVPVWVNERGAAGGYWDTRTYELPDRDWSHDVSSANGGSDSADNGRFEDSSTNRSRGSANTTEAEQTAADEATQRDVDVLLEADPDTVSVGSEVAEVAEASAWGGAVEVASGAFETALDGLLPVVGGAVAAKKVYDHFDKPEDKVGFGALAGGATVAVLCTPPGQLAVGGYVLFKLGQRGLKLWNKHVVNA